MFRVFKQSPKAKVGYIAPMKALVRERVADWKKRLEIKLDKKVVELTGADWRYDSRCKGYCWSKCHLDNSREVGWSVKVRADKELCPECCFDCY